jgi:DUF4097 and DUF4098 domain-containing protein YvlB
MKLCGKKYSKPSPDSSKPSNMKHQRISAMAGLLSLCLFFSAAAQESEDKTQQREQRNAERNRERIEKQKEKHDQKFPEKFSEHISKTFQISDLSKGILAVYNLFGPVTVEGYSGNTITMEIDKTIYAKDRTVLEEGKKDTKLEFEKIGDSVVAYLLYPWDTRPDRDYDREYWKNRPRIEYECYLSFIIKVPASMLLRVSTVNEGDLAVKNVTGTLFVSNVNGGISIENARGTTKAHTINGDLSVNYLSNPPGPSSYYTLNGKLSVQYQSNLSADLQFKSMNGAFYTDFPNAELLPATVTKNEEKRDNGTVYRLNKDTRLRIGNGGSLLKFETLNGNIYIKKQS